MSPGVSPGESASTMTPVEREARWALTVRLPARCRAHIGTLMPRLTSQTFAGQEVQYPMIMPICIRSQKAAELGMSECGAGNRTNVMIAIQPNRPISNAVSDMKSALAAALSPSFSPRPRIGAIAKYWKMMPNARAKM